ncbi:MAG TPA: hypothetical protein VF668_21435 [Pyrinomonadaceae bacterium]|jgi:hypothetical protein
MTTMMTAMTTTTPTMVTAATAERTRRRPADLREGRAGNVTLLTLTLACYVAALACVLALGYSLAALAGQDLGRQAAAIVSPRGF